MEQLLVNKLSYLVFDNTKFNNRMSYLMNTLGVLIILFCAVLFIVRNWFTVDKIIIEGDIRHVTPVQLSYIAHNKLHGTFFTLDIDGLKSEFQELPWVRQVSLQRHFPHTIIVNIEEYNAVARIGEEDLLAEDGEVFDGADDDVNLPTLYVDPSNAVIAYNKYLQIQQTMIKHGDKVMQVWLDNPRILSFKTSKNLTVTICDQKLDDKLNILDKYLDKLYTINTNLTSINMCYKDAVAINSK